MTDSSFSLYLAELFSSFLLRNTQHKPIPENTLTDDEMKVFPYPTPSMNKRFLPSIFSNIVLICSHDSCVE